MILLFPKYTKGKWFGMTKRQFKSILSNPEDMPKRCFVVEATSTGYPLLVFESAALAKAYNAEKALYDFRDGMPEGEFTFGVIRHLKGGMFYYDSIKKPKDWKPIL